MKAISDTLWGVGGVVLVLTMIVAGLLTLPLSVLAVMRIAGWEWYFALIAILLMHCIPAVGQLAYLVLAGIGAYYMIAADFTWRDAIYPPVKAVSILEMSPDSFARMKDTIIRPVIERQCKTEAAVRMKTDADLPLVISRHCECIARVTAEVTTKEDLAYQERTGNVSHDFHGRVWIAVGNRCGPS